MILIQSQILKESNINQKIALCHLYAAMMDYIPPQKQSEIRQRKKVMVCENCGRILVDDDLNNNVAIK